MADWFGTDDESRRMLAEERLVLDVAEDVAEALESRKCSRQELARAIDVSPSELSQRLSGKRNLTLRSLAAMADALDFDVRLQLVDRRAAVVNMPMQRVVRQRVDWPGDARPYTRRQPASLHLGAGVA